MTTKANNATQAGGVKNQKPVDPKTILQERTEALFNKKTRPTPLSSADVNSLGLNDPGLLRYSLSNPPKGNMGGSSYAAVIKNGVAYVNRTNADAPPGNNEWFKLPGKAPFVPGPIRPTPTAVGGFGGGVAKPTPTASPPAAPPAAQSWLSSGGVAQPTPTAVGGGKHHKHGPVARPTPTAVGGGRGGPVARPTPTAIPGEGGGPVARPTPTATPGSGGPVARPTPTAIPGDGDGNGEV